MIIEFLQRISPTNPFNFKAYLITLICVGIFASFIDDERIYALGFVGYVIGMIRGKNP